jgi:hypothetical protein
VVGSDVGYYILLPALGIDASYNESPTAIAVYYVIWAVIAVATFRPLYGHWSRYAEWPWFETRIASLMVWSFALFGPLLFVVFVLPALPPIGWSQSRNPPELRVASAWYFLPKSTEIVFQQLLIVALVLALAARRCTTGTIMACSAAVFGGAHALLIFADVPLGYVARFMIAAAVFGLMFPYFILRLRNGLAYSYMVHWLYYVVTVAMPHIFWQSGK